MVIVSKYALIQRPMVEALRVCLPLRPAGLRNSGPHLERAIVKIAAGVINTPGTVNVF